ncbi:mannose-1-phosphate guanylyltransferase [Fimbriiglobus ruber]|uniref:mannose-1-phosphate guanylyltransferase n=1 Tax=Fimbriiglobus ruber TaxID=1908690 RepID=A0A225EFG1_9BACT|nr:mannose-1-phosphate guanylyltransferase [Fimbriiglobus ruber]OWK46977.1 Mannose-1-phosphate guanylyltransferase (GDP) [Fimbriiglobus ruber]
MLHAMIMAGGGGTRFWPRSRDHLPKQFLTFSGNRTLLQETVDRISAQVPPERTWVITGAKHVDLTREQLPNVPPDQIVGEPFRRDTAACIGLGAALIAQNDPAATMIVMPADHHIEPEREFQRAIHAAEQFAIDYPGALLTFGIPPTEPATGYGYIQRGTVLGERQSVSIAQAKAFKEKPDLEVARQFVEAGDFYWNSGIFVWKTAAILSELRRLKPAMYAAIERITEAWNGATRDEVFRREYDSIEKKSIDYAVMQDAEQVLVMHAPFHWDDVGSWLALERRNPQDAQGNTLQGSHVGIDTQNCVVVSDGDGVVTTIGVNNLIIIKSGSSVLVADRKDEGRVKEIVEQLQKLGWNHHL